MSKHEMMTQNTDLSQFLQYYIALTGIVVKQVLLMLLSSCMITSIICNGLLIQSLRMLLRIFMCLAIAEDKLHCDLSLYLIVIFIYVFCKSNVSPYVLFP